MKRKMSRYVIDAVVALAVYGVYVALVIPVADGSLQYLLPTLLLPAALLFPWLAFVQPGKTRPVLLALSGLAALSFVGAVAMLAFPRGAAVSLGTATLKGNAWPNIRLAIAVVFIICVTVVLFKIAIVRKRKGCSK